MHLSSGFLRRTADITYQESVRGIQWVKNYKFDFRFNNWGQCSVTFTCVAGHIVAQDFNDRYKKWHSCQPVSLFEAPIVSGIAEVRGRTVVSLVSTDQ